jgi:hypothetical protein
MSSPQIEVTTTLQAALGMGSGRAWVDTDPAERETLTLEAVHLLVGLGVDVNAPNANGITAIQTARRLQFQSVVDFLLANGAVEPEPEEETAPDAAPAN